MTPRCDSKKRIIPRYQKERRNTVSRMSQKKKEEWAFFLNARNRIEYNEKCKRCQKECKQSWRAELVYCTDYRSKRAEC